ncbi:LysE family translocator [Paeniglutamicibacter cryotolerans]|uniref:Threonine/homoserine/homoserine lactone efflux protein n=1 Tax=Paeniglutamicibacter cryotolerans TaxID=670079 RepID=A0A839QQ71_9MICC|nr:LysE family translocator [Paeniglutamicibacter cryotolerans]MBB2996904.1 threonine/homoserine/homoserine lactone efflux protein [Paeniglutamicibacter cryotolerans]
MDTQLFLGFTVVSFALAMTPGADWAYAIAAGLGRHRISSVVAGLCTGYVFHTLLIVAGMAALIASLPQLLGWLTLIGAGYLLWLGISTARSWRDAGFKAEPETMAAATLAHRGTATGTSGTEANGEILLLVATPTPVETTPQRFFGASYLRGLGTSGTNPKALLLYLALIPQFLSTDSALPIPVQTAVLGTSHMLLSAVIYTGVALGARVLLRSRPAGARLVTLASGVIMIILGLLLLAEQLPLITRTARMLFTIL